MLTRLITILIALILSTSFFAQTTVGLRLNTDESYQAYTLFSPLNSNNSYLINNCGEMVHEWICDDVAYYTAYLMDNGNLIRYGGSFDSNAEYIEMRDWDNNVIWKWTPPFNYEFIHSDLTIMPNNESFLLIQEQRISAQEWILNGGNPNSINNAAAFENIIEVVPDGLNDVEVIWEWKLFDHVVQDFDATKGNYGVLADNPQLLDINFPNSIGFQEGWVHFNSVDYNETLDQILISCFSCSEIYIIDHSTTTEEAATSVGGIYGKGGDFLYRFGNPANYGLGTAADRKFFGQHNASWVPNGLPHQGKITVHDNGNTRPSGNWSRAVLMSPNILANGAYEILGNGTYSPASFDWEWNGNVFGTTYYSPFYSGVNVQPNGNFVIAEGATGRMFEVTEAGDIVWFYQNPDNGSIVNQGSNTSNARIYRAERYFYDYPAFVGKDLTPIGTIENLNPVTDTCTIYQNFDIAPQANFTIAQTELNVTFINNSTNATSWLWDFGDGNNDTAENPIHIYNNAGDYNVCLYAFNAFATDTFCINITISNSNVLDFTAAAITFSPNPVNDFLTINSNGLNLQSIAIYNNKGQQVLKTAFKTNINLSTLKMGNYIVLLYDLEGKVYADKVLVF